MSMHAKLYIHVCGYKLVYLLHHICVCVCRFAIIDVYASMNRMTTVGIETETLMSNMFFLAYEKKFTFTGS